MAKNNGSNYELNYVTANHFYVEIEGNISASFSECSGVGATIEKEITPAGGINDRQIVTLKHTTFTDVTLKRGVTDSMTFWNWISQGTRRDVNILLFNQAGETMQCWTLLSAVPVGWKASALQASANTVAMEELTLAYEGLKIVKSGGGGAMNLRTRDSSGVFIS